MFKNKTVYITAVSWSLVIAISFIWNIKRNNNEVKKYAYLQAKTIFKKDILMRHWNSLKGGVYARVSKTTIPNPYITIPERDAWLPSGKKITMLNPAYMIREIYDLQKKSDGVQGHLTSLKPLRKLNAPDPWERKQLLKFKKVTDESSEIQTINKKKYMRFMKPLLTKQSCMPCHLKQGYKVGDIRGGISVAIPMQKLYALTRKKTFPLAVSHFVLWIIGLGSLFTYNKYKLGHLRIEQEQNRTLHIRNRAIETSNNSILITDRKGIITFANKMFYIQWGYKNEVDVIGKPITNLFSDGYIQKVIDELSLLKQWTGELSINRKTGKPFYAMLSAAIITDDPETDTTEAGMTFSFTDITMRKHTELQLRLKEEKLREQKDIMDKNLRIAELAQHELLQETLPKISYIEIDYIFHPLEQISGDYFSFREFDENFSALFIGDISGHGIASALFHALIKSVSDKLLDSGIANTSDFLLQLNQELYGNMSYFFISAIGATFEKSADNSVIFSYANAGHPPPIIIRQDGTIDVYHFNGPVLGVIKNTSFESKTITLQQGDSVYFYTDGIPETENYKKEQIGYDKGLLQLFKSCQSDSVKNSLLSIIDGMNSFRGDIPLHDDITLIGVRVR